MGGWGAARRGGGGSNICEENSGQSWFPALRSVSLQLVCILLLSFRRQKKGNLDFSYTVAHAHTHEHTYTHTHTLRGNTRRDGSILPFLRLFSGMLKSECNAFTHDGNTF